MATGRTCAPSGPVVFVTLRSRRALCLQPIAVFDRILASAPSAAESGTRPDRPRSSPPAAATRMRGVDLPAAPDLVVVPRLAPSPVPVPVPIPAPVPPPSMYRLLFETDYDPTIDRHGEPSPHLLSDAPSSAGDGGSACAYVVAPRTPISFLARWEDMLALERRIRSSHNASSVPQSKQQALAPTPTPAPAVALANRDGARTKREGGGEAAGPPRRFHRNRVGVKRALSLSPPLLCFSRSRELFSFPRHTAQRSLTLNAVDKADRRVPRPPPGRPRCAHERRRFSSTGSFFLWRFSLLLEGDARETTLSGS
ncbi:hypothetical protein F5148DRAFT_898111 [Russula earlei]|uniref:Uncharacterized protein n=1 Tax=Russula earlei TaxID=71964 RepID=A0ACC0UMS8_9AGAM|nr:hypothetical protein F5148DRAFT_898111 [Russula earlei]